MGTVREYKSILSEACNKATILGLLNGNPCTPVKVSGKSNSKQSDKKMFLTENEISDLIHFLNNDEQFRCLAPIAFICAYYGLRRSELLGLTWKSIDFAKQLITIERTVVRVRTIHESDETKSENSNRSLALIPMAKRMLETVKDEQEQAKSFYGKEYANKKDYIFTWDDGRAYDPDYISKHFKRP